MAKAFSKAFYKSNLWTLCRNDYIAKRTNADGGLCEQCHEMVGEELHHIIPLSVANIDDREITINHDNLQWLCKDCHFKQHREIIMAGFSQRKKVDILSNGIYIDDDGQVQPQKVYIIYGAPMSGKREYVANNKSDGDLVINLDTIKQSISMSESIDIPHNLISVALSVKDYLTQMVIDKQVDCKNVWVISSLADKQARDDLANSLGAELILIDTTYRQCINNAKALTKDCELTKYLIDKWFEDFQK